jgi:hypothetical protein
LTGYGKFAIINTMEFIVSSSEDIAHIGKGVKDYDEY